MDNKELDDLAQKIENAKKEAGETAHDNPNSIGIAFRAGTEIVAGVFVGYLIGNWLDQLFETEPIFLVLFLVIGFFAGFVNIYRTVVR